MRPVRCCAMMFLLVCLVVVMGTDSLPAQEFRVFTRVSRDLPTPQINAVTGERETEEIVARSLTLFHGGTVYDLLDNIGEVIILEQSLGRITILNTDRQLMTTINMDDLDKFMGKSRQEILQFADQLEQRSDPNSLREAKALRMQIEPEFKPEYLPESNMLRLSNPFLQYEVVCAEPRKSGTGQTFLKYADRMSQLNHVLHPQALYPASRMSLNTQLRQRQKIPTRVSLRISADPPKWLRADHQIGWELDSNDRSMIHRWKKTIKDPRTKQVPFREYQRILLTTNDRSRS